MEAPSLPLSPSLTHASAVWLMAGDPSKSAWETEYFSGKIIPLDLLCNTKAVLCTTQVLCFTFTLPLRTRCLSWWAAGSGFLGAWIKNTSESTCRVHSLSHTHTHTHAQTHTHTLTHLLSNLTSVPSTYRYMHPLNSRSDFWFSINSAQFWDHFLFHVITGNISMAD